MLSDELRVGPGEFLKYFAEHRLAVSCRNTVEYTASPRSGVGFIRSGMGGSPCFPNHEKLQFSRGSVNHPLGDAGCLVLLAWFVFFNH